MRLKPDASKTGAKRIVHDTCIALQEAEECVAAGVDVEVAVVRDVVVDVLTKLPGSPRFGVVVLLIGEHLLQTQSTGLW